MSKLCNFNIQYGVLISYTGNDKIVSIPDGVTKLDAWCFQKCFNMTDIVIPKTVTNIDEYAFIDCNNLKNIKVNKSNPRYYSYDNCLFDSKNNSLVKVPERKRGSYSVPEGINKIEDSAFLSCSNINSVFIPEGVTEIGDWAFFGCNCLNYITLPDSLEIIGKNVFSDCLNLKISCNKGSYGEQYAKENNIFFNETLGSN